MATNKFNIGDLVTIERVPNEFWIVKDFIQKEFYTELGEHLYFEYYLENFRERDAHLSITESLLELKNHLKEFL
jgi:hypothetical protein